MINEERNIIVWATKSSRGISGLVNLTVLEAQESKKMTGLITGKGDGKWGRITINRDGSLLLENTELATAGEAL